MNPVVRLIATMSLALTALLASPAALAVDSGDIVVVSAKGEVHFTVNGAARAVRSGGVLELPATLRTGRDGAVELKQGTTTVSVGPETLLEFPALEKRGAPIDRIVQPRGNAFYNIGKREGRKLRVETPYLVGVIKGTQFNVAVQDDRTTISLFEGLLEVRNADDNAVIDLKAGEIAARQRGDNSISVLKMDGGKAPPTGPRAPADGSSTNGTPSPAAPRVASPIEGGEMLLVDRSGVSPVIPTVTDTLDNTGVAAGTNASLGLATGVEVSTSVPAGGGDSIGQDAGAAVNAAPAVDLGGGSLDVSTSTTVEPAPVDLAAVDLTTSPAVEAGPVTADVGAGATVDLGTGTVDTGVTAAVDAVVLTTDLGTAAAVDLGAGTVSTTVDVGVSTPLAPVDAGVSVAADLGAGTIDLGLGVAGTDLGLGLDLGLDDDDGNNGHGNDADGSDSSNPAQDSDNQSPGIVDVGGLLDGLLRRRKK